MHEDRPMGVDDRYFHVDPEECEAADYWRGRNIQEKRQRDAETAKAPLKADRDANKQRAEVLEAALREMREAKQALESAESRHRQIGSPETLEHCTEARERMNAVWRLGVLAAGGSRWMGGVELEHD